MSLSLAATKQTDELQPTTRRRPSLSINIYKSCPSLMSLIIRSEQQPVLKRMKQQFQH